VRSRNENFIYLALSRFTLKEIGIVGMPVK